MLSLLNPVSEPDGWARFYADMRFAFGANLMLGGRDFEKPAPYGAGKIFITSKEDYYAK